MQIPTCFLCLIDLVIVVLLLVAAVKALPLLQLFQGRLLLCRQLGLLCLVVSAIMARVNAMSQDVTLGQVNPEV